MHIICRFQLFNYLFELTNQRLSMSHQLPSCSTCIMTNGWTIFPTFTRLIVHSKSVHSVEQLSETTQWKYHSHWLRVDEVLDEYIDWVDDLKEFRVFHVLSFQRSISKWMKFNKLLRLLFWLLDSYHWSFTHLQNFVFVCGPAYGCQRIPLCIAFHICPYFAFLANDCQIFTSSRVNVICIQPHMSCINSLFSTANIWSAFRR